ncbi:MAG: ATP-binding protein [Myxococcales bacterium]|nr:ATP-binding protein [Myxococcales bacterium]
MTYVHRDLTDRLQRLIAHFPVVVVTGARQVGKSTLLRHALPGWDTVVLDPVVDVAGARADPDLFLANRPPPLVVDEVQYAPELAAAIKRRVDRDRRPGTYVLTGSQQWSVLRGLAESLAGRAVFLDLEGFSLAERAGGVDGEPWLARWLADPRDLVTHHPGRLPLGRTLYEVLWRGSLPEAWALPLDLVPDLHLAYRRTYIERDVRLLSEVSDQQAFGRFLGLAAALSAQEVNHAHLGRELGIARTTARSWLDLLTATFQWHEVPAWSGNAIKRLSARPKGYFADTGLAAASQAVPSPAALGGHPLVGALFETAAVGEVRRQCARMSPRPNLWHWRTHGGAEVDLVLEYAGKLFPVEVKLTTHPDRRSTSGLRAFRETYGDRVAPGLVLAPVEEARWLTETDAVLPWDTRPT